MRAAADAGRIHGVYLNGDLNAAMAQVPRYGIFGGFRNELVLGLPLMAAMDEAHFTAVLAHEVGHLARRHGRFSARIYGMRQTLDVMLGELARHGRGWCTRCCRSTACSRRGSSASRCSCRRAVEFEADAEAADGVGAQAAAEVLIVLHGTRPMPTPRCGRRFSGAWTTSRSRR